jgi:hypothetical protein
MKGAASTLDMEGQRSDVTAATLGRGIETWKAIVVRYTTALGRGKEESLLL